MRGLYGQSEGNEKRNAVAQFADRLDENEIVEGDHVTKLRQFVTKKQWQKVTEYTANLRKAGHGHTRVESMLTRTMVGLKF